MDGLKQSPRRKAAVIGGGGVVGVEAGIRMVVDRLLLEVCGVIGTWICV